MSILTVLSAAQFDITANASGASADHALARVKTWKTIATNDQKDAAGLGDRYELNQNVMQEQSIDFEVLVAGPTAGSGGEPIACATDITLWDLPTGTHYIGTVQSGNIDVTTGNKDGAGIASAYKFPVAGRTKVTVQTKKLIATYAPFMNTLLTGAVTTFDVAASISFAGSAFVMPMTLKMASHSLEFDGVLQMEDVSLTGKGTPTGPADNSLLGNILLGTSQVALATDTGGGTYSTGSSMFALITKLSTVFQKGELIKQSGTFVFQGAAVYSHP